MLTEVPDQNEDKRYDRSGLGHEQPPKMGLNDDIDDDNQAYPEPLQDQHHLQQYDDGHNEAEQSQSGVPAKPPRSDLSTMSKNRNNRTQRRRGSMSHNGITQKAGAVSIAMQILNMDEEEKSSLMDVTSRHNQRMSDQLLLLIEKLEFFIERIRSEQTGKNTSRHHYFNQNEEGLKEKDDELGQILAKMKKIKNKTSSMRKQLRMSYQIDRITEYENENRLKMKKYNKLLKENEKLKKTKNKQLKELNSMKFDGDWETSKNALADELRTCKERARELHYSNMENKKNLINKHETVILLDKKLRKMQKFMDAKRKNNPKIEKEEEPKPDTKIEDLSEKVKEATQVMEFEEKKMQIEIDRQNAEISNTEHEVQISALKLREKEQEFRLCELKIKELKRQTRHNALKPLEVENTSSAIKTSEEKSYRDLSSRPHNLGGPNIKSENSNINNALELTEENLKQHEENYRELERDEDYEFYSNIEGDTPNKNEQKHKY